MTSTVKSFALSTASEDYWRRLFGVNPDFCSWQTPKQAQVRSAVQARLAEAPGPLRVLDFGIGSLGLYRSLEESGLLARMSLIGISESQQHREDDPLLRRYGIRIAIGPGLSPLASVPSGSQDHVVCSYVFTYLDPGLRSEALQAFSRVLVPNGKLTLVLHHARGERARKFRRSEPYWHKARQLYEQLLAEQYGKASALLADLTDSLNSVFPSDSAYRKYLASYLKTAARLLSMFCVNGQRVCPIPELALDDCESTRRCIERELTMTCQSFRPLDNPTSELELPAQCSWKSLTECVDPSTGFPIAHVLTAVKQAE